VGEGEKVGFGVGRYREGKRVGVGSDKKDLWKK